MSSHRSVASVVLLLALALTVISAACGEQAERAVESVDEAADVVDWEARELVDAAKEGGAADTAKAVEAMRETVDALEKKRGGAEAVAEELSENVENSARVYEETYDAARERGEGAIEAGGEAYEAVLDIPEEKKKESR